MICGCSSRISSATARAIHPLQGFETLGGAADADAVDDAGGFFLAERIDQHLAQEIIRADADRGLVLDRGGEFGDDALNFFPGDVLELRHGGADALHFLGAHVLQHLGGFLLAEGQQQDGGALGARAFRFLLIVIVLATQPLTTCATRFGSWVTRVRACCNLLFMGGARPVGPRWAAPVCSLPLRRLGAAVPQRPVSAGPVPASAGRRGRSGS